MRGGRLRRAERGWAASGRRDAASARRFSPATRAWFEGAFAAPTPAQDGRLGGDRAPASTPWSSRRPARARRWPRSSGRSTGWPATPPPGRAAAPLPGALRLAAEGAGRRRRAQPARAAGRHPAGRRPARAARARRHGRRCAPATPRPTSAARSPARPPDILITTPESLFLLLTSPAREALRGVETVIVDEVHAVAGTKRGAHLALSPRAARRAARAAGAADRAVRDRAPGRRGRPLPRPAAAPVDGRPAAGGEDDRARGRRARSRTWPSSAQPTGDLTGAGGRRASGAPRSGRTSRSASSTSIAGAPLDDRVRQLAPAGRAADRPAQRDLRSSARRRRQLPDAGRDAPGRR